MAFIDRPLNYEPIVFRDYFKIPIRKSMFGYILSLIALIWIYILAFSYVQTRILTSMVIILVILNFYLFFYDKSLHFSPKFFKGSFNRVDLPSLQTFITEISLDPAQNTFKDSFKENGDAENRENIENCNLMLFSNRSNHKVVAVMGLSLRSTALHIQSNFENFLRVLYSLKTNIPLTFQIDLKNMGVKNSYKNSIYGDKIKNLKNDTMSRNSHSTFEYTIFITRTYRFPSKNTVDNLLYMMKQNYITISNVLESNFAHFKFSPLHGSKLINSIRGSITGEGYELVKKDLVLNSVPNHKGYILWIRPILVYLANMVVLWFLTSRIDIDILYYVMICFSIISSIVLILNFWHSKFFDFNDSNFSMIDMFPSGEFHYHKLSKSIHYYDYLKKKIYSKIHYSLTTLNRSFRFNQVKFYRSLLHHVVSGNFSFSIQFHTRRISSMDRFKGALKQEFWNMWTNTPDLRSSLERRHCGFYFFQPIFSIGMVRDQNIVQISDSDLVTNVKTLQNTFLPLLNIAFPNCGMVPIKPNIIYQYLTKARLYSTFNSLLNLHFTTGTSLVPFIAIPEEIHRYLPINYAGEFSTPLLQDEIIFGHTFNPENNSIETLGGISFNELKENVLFLGESYQDVQKGITRFVAELLTHGLPCIIFDWDGTWKHLVGQLEFHNALNKINYVSVGENFGIKLFDLPYNRRGPLFISYISSIIDVFGRVFHYGDDQLALLKSAWSSEDGGNIKISTIAGKFSDDGIKKLYLDKNPVLADLNLLQKDYLVKIFDTAIENWISLDLILDNSSTLVINLESLKDNNLKNLFIQAFLAQYQYVFEMELKENGQNNQNSQNNQKIPRSIVLPVLDILFNNRIETRQNTQINSTLSQLLKQQHILIGSGTHISDIHQTIFNIFKNRFVFRNQLEINLRIMEYFLNFDDNFTNIQHLVESSRKISYQAHYLSTIDPEKCIILRQNYNTPYVFQFDYANYFESDEMNRVIETEIKEFEVIPERIVIKKEINRNETILDSDFSDEPAIIDSLYLFLKNCDAKLDHGPNLSKDQITTNLFELLSNNSDGELTFTQTKVDKIFSKLNKFDYLTTETTSGGKNHEIKGYKITQKARRCINDQELEMANDETQEMPDDLTFEDVQDIEEENILPATIPPKKHDDNKISDKEWMDDFELELSEIIVPCRMKYEKGNYRESYEFLKSGWERAMEKIENYPKANGLPEKLRERYQWIKETDSTNKDELLKLINRIEYFVISI